MAAKKVNEQDISEQLKLYDEIIELFPEIERKGKTLPYTSVNGNMFSFLSKEGELSIRLPENERELFIKKYKSQLSVQHGVVMKEYVLVPEELLYDKKAFKKYFKLSFEYASSLKKK
ncbi:MAG: hypothetical protein IPI31_06695 [Bacteroidetes bacterium]|nr:hypothetical protein [Bacteroidota bacterium]